MLSAYGTVVPVFLGPNDLPVLCNSCSDQGLEFPFTSSSYLSLFTLSSFSALAFYLHYPSSCSAIASSSAVVWQVVFWLTNSWTGEANAACLLSWPHCHLRCFFIYIHSSADIKENPNSKHLIEVLY